jgi:hypothetical protein
VIGDRKNDGYDKTTGTYYQVFAPEDLKASEAKAVKKLKEDFKGLYEFWNKATPVKSFHFVMNDKFAGSFPEIEADLAEIKKSHKLASQPRPRLPIAVARAFVLDADSEKVFNPTFPKFRVVCLSSFFRFREH